MRTRTNPDPQHCNEVYVCTSIMYDRQLKKRSDVECSQVLLRVRGWSQEKVRYRTLEVVFGISWNNLDDVLNPDAELAVLVIARLIRQDHPSLQACNTTQLPIQSVRYLLPYDGPPTELRAKIRLYLMFDFWRSSLYSNVIEHTTYVHDEFFNLWLRVRIRSRWDKQLFLFQLSEWTILKIALLFEKRSHRRCSQGSIFTSQHFFRIYVPCGSMLLRS